MELTARYGLEFNPFLKNSKRSFLKVPNIRKRDSAWITFPEPKDSVFLPVHRAVEKQLWYVPGLPD